MKTLRQIIEDMKIRKGPAAGTTKRGAFWLVPLLANNDTALKIRSWGGDGIGNNAANLDSCLMLRHYRDGSVAAVCRLGSWHQNHDSRDEYTTVNILDCTTVEEVIVALKASRYRSDEAVYGDYFRTEITEALTRLGMPEAMPGPDEI